MQILRYIAISLISGLTAIIPGVSGGTIFAIFGISEHMARDINNLVDLIFNSLNTSFKDLIAGILKYGKLPLIIGLGSLFSSLFYAKVLLQYGHTYEYFLRFLFIGLVVFSVPTLWAETNSPHILKKSKLKYLYVLLGFFFALILFNSNEAIVDSNSIDYGSVGYLFKFFLVSLVAGITAILPGISGTNILIIGGVFDDYILFSSQIGNYPLQYGMYLLAAIIGSIIAAKCFTLLFKYFRQGFFSIMTGLTASTIVFIWATPISIETFVQSVVGFTVSYFLIKTLNEQELNTHSKN